jgi:putative sterol carrier protein
MERRFEPERAAGLNAVVQWEIARPGGGADRWQLVIGDGRCRATRRLDREPTLTLKLDDVTFLDLVTGAANGPALYMSGRLRVEGDPMRAAALTSAFKVPRPAN